MMAFLKLTDPFDGTTIYILVAAISAILEPEPRKEFGYVGQERHSQDGRSIVVTGDGNYKVAETQDEILDRLRQIAEAE